MAAILLFFLIYTPFSSGDYEVFKAEMLREINAFRTSGCNCGGRWMPAISPLTWDNALARSAAGHAIDMEALNYFSHISRDGRTIAGRISALGYDWSSVAENIAFGQRSIRQVITDWMASPGHCINIMNPKYQNIGVAKKGKYWVMDLAAPR